MRRRTPFIDLSGVTPSEAVTMLADKHRRGAATGVLLRAGSAATPAVRQGLKHDDPQVRIACCKILDHFMDEAALSELFANVKHPDPGVRSWAIHALACDRCKEGACRPGEDDVIPLVIRALSEDPNRHVRQQAAGMLGPSVRRSAAALAAIERAHREDPHPAVRKVAGWWVPGGPRYNKLAKLGSA